MSVLHAATQSMEQILPAHNFEDQFSIELKGQSLDALTAAKRAFGRAPNWVVGLMNLRNRIVAPFGLKSAGEKGVASKTGINPFPIISQTPSRVVMGFDDHHLDFRVVVDVSESGNGMQSIQASTLVKTNNWVGKIYLTMVMPFHKLIVPTMLRRVAADR
jgi:hypothetical protein